MWASISTKLEESVKRNGENSDILILSAASYISNLLGYNISKQFDNVSFVDIGTALHPLMGLGLIRDYLITYWKDPKKYKAHKCDCII